MMTAARTRTSSVAGQKAHLPTRPATGSLDRVFKALASEIRREMLDVLRDGPRTTSDLVMHFPELSRFAVMQHLKVLAKSRLVVAKKRGRERHNFLNVVPLQQLAERWMGPYEALWAGALTSLRERAEGSPKKEHGHDREGLSHRHQRKRRTRVG